MIKKILFFFSTPFDAESVYFLNDIGVKLIKVASLDIANFEILRAISKTKLPTIISTGMATKNEIDRAYKFFKSRKLKFSFLHCVSNYPNREETSYLSCINYLKENYNCPIGISDHTNDIATSIYGYLMGAKIIEKHFVSNLNFKCVDLPVSITEEQMRNLVNKIMHLKKVIGTPVFGNRKEEKNSYIFKRKKK